MKPRISSEAAQWADASFQVHEDADAMLRGRLSKRYILELRGTTVMHLGMLSKFRQWLADILRKTIDEATLPSRPGH